VKDQLRLYAVFHWFSSARIVEVTVWASAAMLASMSKREERKLSKARAGLAASRGLFIKGELCSSTLAVAQASVVPSSPDEPPPSTDSSRT
jgi:hypothetical protein